MELTTIAQVSSSIDNVTKYIVEDSEFGKNEVSVIRKADKIIFCLPTQTNCKMGCAFCHLTGTTRPVKNLSHDWFVSAIDHLIKSENLPESETFLVSFMGAGEPLNNLNNMTEACEIIHTKYENIRFGMATMCPSVSAIKKLTRWAENHKHIRFKLHLSVHGIRHRDRIIKSNVDIETAINHTIMYAMRTGNPIEFHYAIVAGYNDQLGEILEFSNLTRSENATIKFLTVSENNGCHQGHLPEEMLATLFPSRVVEFYNPPGRDVGASCGMFDQEIYNA